MKRLKWIAAGLVILAAGATKTVVGQDAASAGVQDSFSSANVSLASATDEQIMLQAVESVTPVPFANISVKQRAGTFWSAQHPPDSPSSWPPLPGNIFNLPVWPLGDGQYLLDDRQVDYVAIQSAIEAEAALTATPKTRTSMSMMASSLASSYAYGNPVYLTNLVVSAGDSPPITASFSIGGGTNFVPYDILMTTNVAMPVGSWNWLGIGYTANNYTFTNQPADLGFYMLAKPSKTMTVGIGDDSIGECDVPYGLTNALQVAAGFGQSLVLLNNGTIVAWGFNSYGQATVPTGLSGVTMVSAGWYHSVAVLTNGTVSTWGMSGPPWYVDSVPANLTNATVISAKALHTIALRSNGTVAAWGYGGAGETTVPAGLTNVVAISAGYQFNLAVVTNGNGTVVAWGANNYGQTNVPAGLSNVVDVAAGMYHSLAMLQNGTVVAWGDNAFGETTVPAALSNVVAIAAAGRVDGYNNLIEGYSVALKSDGTVVEWGSDAAVTPLGGLNNVIAIAAGSDHVLAVRTGPPTPVITLEPTNQYQIVGGAVTFSAKGQGLYGVTYQWQTNGVNLTSANSATLTLTNVQAAQTGVYDVVVTDNGGMGSIVSSNANFYLVTPPVITSQNVPTNIVTIYGKYVFLAATAWAPYQTNGFPLTYQWQFNGTNIPSANPTNYSFVANDNSSGIYTLHVSNAAGSTNASWQVTVTNAINVTNDLLLIYNTNSADSTTVLNYYLAHRPNVGGANVLGIGYTNAVSPSYYETVTPTDLTNQIFNPMLSWLAANPTKRPQYVILFMDLPSKVNTNSSYPTNGYPPYNDPGIRPSVSFQIHSEFLNWQPFVTYLNMGMPSVENRTNDCIAYINKLAALGTLTSSNSPILSASANGYGNTNFVFDNVRFNTLSEPYGSSGGVLASAKNNLLTAGVSTNAIGFYDATIISYYFIGASTNYSMTFSNNTTVVTVTNNNLLFHATSATNVSGYVSWGVHGGFTPYQNVSLHGNSGWWLIETFESYNGQQVLFPGSQGSFVNWFSSNAFGGTYYSNTPVGAISSVDEPFAIGVCNPSNYIGSWAAGKNFGICAWNLLNSDKLQAIGDPLIIK